MSKVIYLNAGHGGMHPQTGTYMTFPTHGKFYEFVGKGYTAYEGRTNRIFAQLFETAMEGTGIQIVRTHHPFLDRQNTERTQIANAHFMRTRPKKALWLSWHSNATGMDSRGESQPARGYSIFTSAGETSADSCAKLIFEETQKATQARFGVTFRSDMRDGNPDFDINFDELAFTFMPAVLIENLFFTNYEDAMLLLDKSYQEAVIKATKIAVLKWFDS